MDWLESRPPVYPQSRSGELLFPRATGVLASVKRL